VKINGPPTQAGFVSDIGTAIPCKERAQVDYSDTVQLKKFIFFVAVSYAVSQL